VLIYVNESKCEFVPEQLGNLDCESSSSEAKYNNFSIVNEKHVMFLRTKIDALSILCGKEWSDTYSVSSIYSFPSSSNPKTTPNPPRLITANPHHGKTIRPFSNATENNFPTRTAATALTNW
jgi:hypothetical protein